MIDMSFLHFDSITVMNILVVIMGLWLIFLILQVVLMIKIIKELKKKYVAKFFFEYRKTFYLRVRSKIQNKYFLLKIYE